MIYCWTCIHGETTADRCTEFREFVETVSVNCREGHKMDDTCPHYEYRHRKEMRDEK